jgi:hypothetical protein
VQPSKTNPFLDSYQDAWQQAIISEKLKSKSQPEELANKKNNFKRSYFRIIQ